MSAGPSLTLVNANVHEALDARLIDVYEALLGLDLDATRALWRAFVSALDAHMQVEDTRVFPHWEAVPDRPPRSGVDLYTRDHDLVRSRLRDVNGVLAELTLMPPEGRRRYVASQLEPLVRFRAVLEHHGIRENEQLYPGLDAALGADVRIELASTLLEAARPLMTPVSGS